jgi:hypothetical protein
VDDEERRREEADGRKRDAVVVGDRVRDGADVGHRPRGRDTEGAAAHGRPYRGGHASLDGRSESVVPSGVVETEHEGAIMPRAYRNEIRGRHERVLRRRCRPPAGGATVPVSFRSVIEQ